MKVLQIIPAQLSHAALLSELASRTFHATYAHANTKEDMQQYIRENFTEEEIIKEISDEHTFLFIAFEHDVAIGYIKLGTATSPEKFNGKPTIEIERIYVDKEFQSKKVGKVLLNKAIEFSNEKNIKTIWLGVWKKNLKAIKFYEREGFVKFGEQIFTLGRDLQEDFIMKKEL